MKEAVIDHDELMAPSLEEGRLFTVGAVVERHFGRPGTRTER